MIQGAVAAIAGALKGIVGLGSKFVERKQAKDALKARAAIAKLDNEAKRDITDAEWEAISAGGLNSTLKDEYVTLIITSPILLIVVGAGLNKPEIMDRGILAINALNNAGVPMDLLMGAVVLAAIGLKAIK